MQPYAKYSTFGCIGGVPLPHKGIACNPNSTLLYINLTCILEAKVSKGVLEALPNALALHEDGLLIGVQ